MEHIFFHPSKYNRNTKKPFSRFLSSQKYKKDWPPTMKKENVRSLLTTVEKWSHDLLNIAFCEEVYHLYLHMLFHIQCDRYLAIHHFLYKLIVYLSFLVFDTSIHLFECIFKISYTSHVIISYNSSLQIDI